MKVSRGQLVFHAAILVFVFTATGRADEADTAVSKQALQAKLTYCKTCHGVSARGYRGYFAMPRLAGQQPEYLQNQLQAFVERRRLNSVMFNVAHVLGPAINRLLLHNLKISIQSR